MSTAVKVPFSEPPWLMGFNSPYYNSSHRRWQKTCREFVEKTMMSGAGDWEKAGSVPDDLYAQFASANFLVPNLSSPLPVELLKEVGLSELPGGLKAEEFDYLHTLIYTDEMARIGTKGPSGAITIGFAFGFPPILKFGSTELKKRFAPDIIRGRKRICIAITEPDAGSDVANIATTALRSEDNKYFILNGSKKWISNGIWSDYATMLVRTGGPGPKGLSLVVVPLKDNPGVTMRRMSVTGQTAAGTTFIDLDDVKVPVENLIGKENSGMLYVMQNFNHERLTISVTVNRLARVALSSAFEYCLKREAFGKTLMEQPVVRHRLAKCGAALESHYAWVEGLVYQATKMSKEEANAELGGLTALAKAQAGIVLNECASTAVLLFGGNGYTKTGQGETVERIYREISGSRIPGGSEDVMLDLAIRQLVKNFQTKLKELKTEGNAKPSSRL